MNDNAAFDEAVKATRKYVTSNPTSTVAATVEVVKNQQMASALKSYERVQIFMAAVITPEFFKNGDVGRHKDALERLIGGNQIVMRHAIAGAERMLVDTPKVFPVLLKTLYDEDVVDEDAILLWAGCEGGEEDEYLVVLDEGKRGKLREAAKPLVEWLEEAESEEDSSGEE